MNRVVYTLDLGRVIGGFLVLLVIGYFWWNNSGPGKPAPSPTASARAYVAATTRPSPTPRTSSASPTPRSIATRSATPSTTPRPRLEVVALTYEPTGCWSSSWFDADGRATAGTRVKFTATIKNRGDTDSDSIWLAHETFLLDGTNPVLARGHNLGKDADDTWGHGSDSLVVGISTIPAGETLRWKWSVIFQTAADFDHVLEILLGDFRSGEFVAGTGAVSTASRRC